MLTNVIHLSVTVTQSAPTSLDPSSVGVKMAMLETAELALVSTCLSDIDTRLLNCQSSLI